jgi:hypothetical protein
MSTASWDGLYCVGCVGARFGASPLCPAAAMEFIPQAGRRHQRFPVLQV